ncbi:MAG: hypothetical protein JXO72_09595 [Vicinamibacteria bacterium]|nr:hypothetical protein [Vicinamibacteria bacterium]
MSKMKSAVLIALGATFLMRCSDSTNPSKWSSIPNQVAIAAATPTPTPTPTPRPTPSPTPYVAPHHSQLVCEEEIPWLFKGVLIDAQERIKQHDPQWFDYNIMHGWIIVLKPGRYFNEVIDVINSMDGYEASPHFYEPDTHIAIKNSNDFSETYQIITSFNGVASGYAFTCRPAEF